VTRGLFHGVKVIDCGSYIAGPAAATVMSDFGAEVIKIEPLTGDPYRTRNQPPKVESAPVNPHWLMDSRKHSLCNPALLCRGDPSRDDAACTVEICDALENGQRLAADLVHFDCWSSSPLPPATETSGSLTTT